MTPADIARALLDEPCPHAGSPFVIELQSDGTMLPTGYAAGPRKASCDLCLTDTIERYARECVAVEREACAAIVADHSEATDLRSNVRRLEPRLRGSIEGTAYAAAIRARRTP